jgi:hypothetical protein
MTVGILGDALQAYAQVKAGGTAGGQGPFISGLMKRQQQYQDQLAEFENQRQRGLENLLKIQEQTKYHQAQADRLVLQDNIRQVVEAQRLGFEKQRIEIAERNAATAEERLALQQQLGQINVAIREQGIGLREQGLALQRQQFEFSKSIKRNRPLPPSITLDISGAREAGEAAETALSEWVRLGKPDLGLMFSITPDRGKSPKGLEARRKIAEALLPIRKYFSGTAVSESERKEAEPIIAKLEGGVAPNVLEQALRGLASMARRKERALLRDAELAGFNVEGFKFPEPTRGPGGELVVP